MNTPVAHSADQSEGKVALMWRESECYLVQPFGALFGIQE